MATEVFTNVYFMLNSVDLSAYVVQASLPNLTRAALKDTAMGSTTGETFAVGLPAGSFSVTFNADFAASASEATIYAVHNGGAAVTFEVCPNGSTVATTNPKYSGSCILTSYTPIEGATGDKGSIKATFQITGAVTRAIA